jgi:hypothetical protein
MVPSPSAPKENKFMSNPLRDLAEAQKLYGQRAILNQYHTKNLELRTQTTLTGARNNREAYDFARVLSVGQENLTGLEAEVSHEIARDMHMYGRCSMDDRK